MQHAVFVSFREPVSIVQGASGEKFRAFLREILHCPEKRFPVIPGLDLFGFCHNDFSGPRFNHKQDTLNIYLKLRYPTFRQYFKTMLPNSTYICT